MAGGGSRIALALALLAAALWSGPALAGAALAGEGEALEGAVVERVEHHPEYQRYHLRLDDGRPLQVEVVALADNPGVCSAAGLTLFPRWELLGLQIPPEEGRHPAVADLCQRLAAAEREAPEALPALAPAWEATAGRRRAMGALGLGLLAGLLAAALGTPLRSLSGSLLGAGAAAAGALAIRLAVSPLGIFNGDLAGYEKLELALHPGAAMYGGAWAALMGGTHALFGPAPEEVFGTNLVLAALSCGALWVLLRALAGAPAAWLGALALGVLPLHLKLSGSEVMHIALLALELVALAATVAAARGRGIGAPGAALAAACATALVLYTRPEALPFAALPPLWALLLAPPGGRLRPAALAVIAGALLAGGWRAWEVSQLLAADPDPVIGPSDFADPGWWLTTWLPGFGAAGAGRTHVFLNLGLTPPLLLAAAAWGGWRSLRGPERAVGLALIAWYLLTALPVLPKDSPLADAYRLQLPAQGAGVALAALGLADVARRLPGRWRVLPALAVAAGALAWLPWIRQGWAHQEEWTWLRAAAGRLEGPAVVLYSGEPARAEHFGSQLRALSPPDVLWIRAGDPIPPDSGPLRFYRGVRCAASPGGSAASPEALCREIWRRCDPRPLDTGAITAHTDLDLSAPGEDLTVGFYDIRCPVEVL